MHVPKHFEETNVSVLHALVEAHPLGTWITEQAGELTADHVPFLLDASRGPHGTLVGHVARANPVWRSFSGTRRSLVVFQGTETYITPSWYASKKAHGKAVPTWNYAVVHAHGFPRAIEDSPWLREHLDRLVATHEAREPLPWKIADAPPDFVAAMLERIVGIEIPIDTLIGKWKVSQNRSEADRLGVVAGLRARGGEPSARMAELVRAYTTPAPPAE